MAKSGKIDTDRIFDDAMDHWNRGQLFEARKLLLSAAANGDTSSQLNYGVFCEAGLGGPKDIQKALYWYRRAALTGTVAPLLNIADLYRKLGNRRRMYFWLRRALKTSEGDAKLEMARELLNGRGLGTQKRAARLLRNAVQSPSITEDDREEAAAILSDIPGWVEQNIHP